MYFHHRISLLTFAHRSQFENSLQIRSVGKQPNAEEKPIFFPVCVQITVLNIFFFKFYLIFQRLNLNCALDNWKMQ